MLEAGALTRAPPSLRPSLPCFSSADYEDRAALNGLYSGEEVG